MCHGFGVPEFGCEISYEVGFAYEWIAAAALTQSGTALELGSGQRLRLPLDSAIVTVMQTSQSWLSNHATKTLGTGSASWRLLAEPEVRSVVDERLGSALIRGAPQIGFSLTVRKMRSRTFFEILLPPAIRQTLEMARQ